MSIPSARTLHARGIAPGFFSHSKTPAGRLIAGARSTVGRWFAHSRQRRALREIAERNDFHLLKRLAGRGVARSRQALLAGLTSLTSRTGTRSHVSRRFPQ